MKLVKLVPITAILIALLIGMMLLIVEVEQWHRYQSAQEREYAIQLIRDAMTVVEKISFERGPANGVLGDEDQPDSVKQERLHNARAVSDAAIAKLQYSLELDSKLHGIDIEQALYKTKILLIKARSDVDSVARLPKRERTQERIMTGAVYSMFNVIPAAVETVTLLMQKADQVCGPLPNAVSKAQLANELREYAGRLGSQFTHALTKQTPLMRTEAQAIHLLRGRIEELRSLIELPVRLDKADPRAVTAVAEMEQNYFDKSLNFAASMERLSYERHPYNIDTAQFAALYVPGMGSIVKLRDVFISIALEEAQAETVNARESLIERSLVGGFIVLTVTLIFFVIHRRIIHPLFKIAQALNSLAHGDLNTEIPKSKRDDEIGDIFNAICMLRDNYTERRKLELERQRLIDELETSEIHQVALINELEQRMLQQTALLKHSVRGLENSLYSVANDLHTQLHVLHPIIRILSLQNNEESTENFHKHSGSLHICVKKLESSLAMLHELRWLWELNISYADIDMVTTISCLVETMKQHYPKTTVEIGDLPRIVTDRTMIHKIITNLLDNAFKYSAKVDKPNLEIGCWNNDCSKTFWIRDNGIGFNPSSSKRIFEPFTRLVSDDEYEGNGIGLAVTYRLVERLGGRIWADSSPGQGATFFFTLSESTVQMVSVKEHQSEVAADDPCRDEISMSQHHTH